MTNTTPAMISGILFLHIFSNGMVQEQFRPQGLDGTTRPILATSTDAAQSDLTRVFDLSLGEAQSAILRLCRDGYVELAISVAESKLQRLFRSKP